jgi:hypothetical protein
MKRLLIVSPHFPPVNAPDAHRVLGALPHLTSLGWETCVLCVDSRDIDLPSDQDSVTGLPSEVKVVSCRALSSRLTRWFGVRTLGWRARGSLYRAGRRIIEEWKPDLVFFSTTQNLLVAAGPRWKREFGVPFVVDVQDPWITDYYDKPDAPKPPGGWKYALSRRLNARLEKRVFDTAEGVVSVSPDYLRDLAARHAAFGATEQRVIPFGADPAAFQEAVAHARVAFLREPGKIHLVSLGAIGPIMRTAVTTLCAQLHGLRNRHPSLAEKLRLHFIGTSYAPGDVAARSVMPIARAHNVDDLVSELTARISWRDAQASMAAADGLIVLTSQDGAYTPSKLAGCFLAGRPALIVTQPESRTTHIAAELGLGTCMQIGDGATDALHDFITDLHSENPAWPRRRRPEQFELYHTTRARTRELTAFFHIVLQHLQSHS